MSKSKNHIQDQGLIDLMNNQSFQMLPKVVHHKVKDLNPILTSKEQTQQLIDSLSPEVAQLLHDTFYCAIGYWCPRNGWEDDAFASFIQHRVDHADDYIAE
jgi:hypothetical protein